MPCVCQMCLTSLLAVCFSFFLFFFSGFFCCCSCPVEFHPFPSPPLSLSPPRFSPHTRRPFFSILACRAKPRSAQGCLSSLESLSGMTITREDAERIPSHSHPILIPSHPIPPSCFLFCVFLCLPLVLFVFTPFYSLLHAAALAGGVFRMWALRSLAVVESACPWPLSPPPTLRDPAQLVWLFFVFFFFLSSLPGDVLVVLMWQFSSAVRWCEGKQGEAVEWAHHTDGEEGEGGSLWFGLH